MFNKYEIVTENDLEKKITDSEVFRQGSRFISKGIGHPEKNVGVHIKQILNFIDKQKWGDYRRDLRLLALLHDLGKQRVEYSEKGHVIGKGHSLHSVDIAREFISDQMLQKIIGVHDKYIHFYKDSFRGKFKEPKFRKTYYNQDMGTLIRFNYADSNNRERDPIIWFEDTLNSLGMEKNKIYETDLK